MTSTAVAVTCNTKFQCIVRTCVQLPRFVTCVLINFWFTFQQPCTNETDSRAYLCNTIFCILFPEFCHFCSHSKMQKMAIQQNFMNRHVFPTFQTSKATLKTFWFNQFNVIHSMRWIKKYCFLFLSLFSTHFSSKRQWTFSLFCFYS